MRDCLRNKVLVIRNNLSNMNNVSAAYGMMLDLNGVFLYAAAHLFWTLPTQPTTYAVLVMPREPPRDGKS